MSHLRNPIGHVHVIPAILLMLLALACASCQDAPSADAAPVTLRISGSTSMAPVLRELADAYRKKHPNVRVEVLGNDSQTGLRELKADKVDLAAVSWKADGEEMPKDLQAIPFARDGIAVIVHPRNRIADLTLAQVRSIYRGEVLDWQVLGGPPVEPIVISREDGSGTREAFESLAMGGERVTFNALVMPNTRAVMETVGQHREAIGYVSMSALTDTVRAVPVEGLSPTPANVRSGAYHLIRYLYLFTRATPDRETQRFLDFIHSAEGQAIVGRRHVPLR